MDSEVMTLLEHKIRMIESDGKYIYLVGPIQLPVQLYGETFKFQWYCWLNCKEKEQDLEAMVRKLSDVNLAEMQQSSVLAYGDFENSDDVYVRLHSICHTGDIFGSKRCDCGYQLHQSLKMIAEHGAGALFYLANHEGRGIGLFSKAMAYLLQEQGADTVDANLQLGFADDARNYSDAIAVLKELRHKPVTLITNNPRKLEALRAAGMNVGKRIALWGDRSEFNERYLQTKIKRSGHFESSCPNDD
ncbi:GTP cyclohydrolase II [Paenibacillus protaetiae]|uniref:GTP cyclohydrolase II n=1 Tax=Paenibacillus protaetiae TaxID=2509456 RepID=A0A4P6F0C6_9BACL|nr:GTP cyclohydrolase II [Paenibacillus protaetiae]QAY68043.1 GTP cyclohydrolase II [Paenibacillus protaetiae]